MTLTPCGRIEIDFHVRWNTVVLDFPLAIQSVNCGARCGHVSAVDQLGIAADADEPSPGFLADERADSCFAEVPRQRVTAGS